MASWAPRTPTPPLYTACCTRARPRRCTRRGPRHQTTSMDTCSLQQVNLSMVSSGPVLPRGFCSLMFPWLLLPSAGRPPSALTASSVTPSTRVSRGTPVATAVHRPAPLSQPRSRHPAAGERLTSALLLTPRGPLRRLALTPLVPLQMRALSMAVNHADLEALAYQQELHAHHQYQQCYNKQTQDKSFRNRPVQPPARPSLHRRTQ